jgi:hypothetical protein
VRGSCLSPVERGFVMCDIVSGLVLSIFLVLTRILVEISDVFIIAAGAGVRKRKRNGICYTCL